MEKPIIAIKTTTRDYSGLVKLGGSVAEHLNTNPHFLNPTPTIPALTEMVAQVTEAIAVWGPKGNRGSRASLYDLRAKAVTLSQTLKSLAQYVQLTAQTIAGSDYPLMASIIGTSGFSLAKTKAEQGLLQPVENFRRLASLSLDANKVKLVWKQPLNVTSRKNVLSYLVYRGTTNVFSNAIYVRSVSKGVFIDTNTTGTTVTYFYWVVPVGAAGNGAASAPLPVSILPA